ncbi:MAG: helix-turn-helix transcriptional regulator [Candidatus Methanofastidiosum sp.]|nr:helix-turn-helix transcriptional regulator [Methanofastidiosum sp.]
MTPEEKLGNLIREYREKRGLLLQELGKKVDVNYTHISYIEKGLRTPSEELLAKLAHVFAENEQEEKELRERFFFYLAQIKAPKEIRSKLRLKGGRETKQEQDAVKSSMPRAFLDLLRKHVAVKPPEFFDEAGIPYKRIRKVLDGEGWLERAEVIKLATLLGGNVNEYLLKAEYIPEEFEAILGRKSVIELMRSLKKLPPEQLDKMISAIETILQTVIKNDESTR